MGKKCLGTKVLFKDMARHVLMFHKSSFHPFKRIVKSQLILFHRICSLAEDVEVLFRALRSRG